MNKNLLDKIISFVFCLTIFAGAALFFLLPKESFSGREKRYLATLPELSEKSLADGSFTKKLSEYVADHFPGRELFVGINAYYDLLSGRQSTKDYFLAGGRLYAAPAEKDLRTLDANLEAVNAFRQDLAAAGAEIPVTLMLVPSSGAVLLEEPEYPDAEIIAYAYERAETGHVDLLADFLSADDPAGLYYRTDHHWTSEGAFRAVCAYRSCLGLSCPQREDYVRQSHAPFYGSAYSASGLWLTEPDSLELWYSGNAVQVTNETGRVNGSVFYHDHLKDSDMYTVFLDGNHSQVRIENLSIGEDEGRNLLVVRDSFSNSLGCFLSDLYKKVILVDLRYYKLPLTELLAEEEIDEILIEYSVDMFLHDGNLAFLSVEPELLREKLQAQSEPEPEEEPAPRPANYFAPPQELDDDFFAGAYYLGDSVIGPLNTYCLQNEKLTDTVIATNAMLSYYEVVHQIQGHLIYRGRYTTMPELLREAEPRLLIMALGCNDLATFDLDVVEESLTEFLAMVRDYDPELPIFIQSVMPIRANMVTFNQQEVDDFNAWLSEHAEEFGYCYLELDRYFKGPDGKLSEDYKYNDTHLTLAGGPVWYEQLLNVDNYHNLPQQFLIEYDGETGLPVESLPAEDAPEEDPAPPEPPEEAEAESLLDEIYAQIRLQLSCPEMLTLSEQTAAAYLGLPREDYLDGRFYLCANNLKADEIWLLELPDEAAAQDMLARAQARIELKADSYAKYLPEESELARRGLAVAEGRYVALFISPDAQEMREIFLAALKSG